MSDPQQIERDLQEYLAQEPNLRKEDKIKFLRTIFNKHFDINKFEHQMNYYDFMQVYHQSKSDYSNFRLPMNISRKKIESQELPYVAMIESFISYLNKNNLLKKLVKFDYTE